MAAAVMGMVYVGGGGGEGEARGREERELEHKGCNPLGNEKGRAR